MTGVVGLGIEIACSGCGLTAVLAYTDLTWTRVNIDSIEGWSSPPLRCPTCAADPKCEHKPVVAASHYDLSTVDVFCDRCDRRTTLDVNTLTIDWGGE